MYGSLGMFLDPISFVFKRGRMNPAVSYLDTCCNVIMVASQIRHSADTF